MKGADVHSRGAKHEKSVKNIMAAGMGEVSGAYVFLFCCFFNFGIFIWLQRNKRWHIYLQ